MIYIQKLQAWREIYFAGMLSHSPPLPSLHTSTPLTPTHPYPPSPPLPPLTHPHTPTPLPNQAWREIYFAGMLSKLYTETLSTGVIVPYSPTDVPVDNSTQHWAGSLTTTSTPSITTPTPVTPTDVPVDNSTQHWAGSLPLPLPPPLPPL